MHYFLPTTTSGVRDYINSSFTLTYIFHLHSQTNCFDCLVSVYFTENFTENTCQSFHQKYKLPKYPQVFRMNTVLQ